MADDEVVVVVPAEVELVAFLLMEEEDLLVLPPDPGLDLLLEEADAEEVDLLLGLEELTLAFALALALALVGLFFGLLEVDLAGAEEN